MAKTIHEWAQTIILYPFQISSSSCGLVFSVRPLLGEEDEDVSLAARKVAEAVTEVDDTHRAFIVSIGFRQGVINPKLIGELVEFVKEEFVKLE